MHMYGVFASRWPAGDQTLWTIVNRNEYDVDGRQMNVPSKPGMRYFDLYHGVELNPAWANLPQPVKNDWANVTVSL